MTADVFRFELMTEVPLIDAEMSLQLAILAVGGLFGEARVRLHAGYFVDEPRRALIVDGTTAVGAAVVRVFTSFLIHDHGEDSFHVRRVQAQANERRMSA